MPYVFQKTKLTTRQDLEMGKVLLKTDQGQILRDFAARQPREEPVAVTPPAEPTFEKGKQGNFGVMRHVDPVRDHFLLARTNLEALRMRAIQPRGQKPSLVARVQAFLKLHLQAETWKDLLDDLDERESPEVAPDFTNRFRPAKRPLPRLGMRFKVKVEDPEGKVAPTEEDATHNAHTALFHTSVGLTDDIRDLELMRNALAGLLDRMALDQDAMEEDLRDVESALPAALALLEALNRPRLEALEDYALVQKLLAEHWQEVERATARRKQVIASSPMLGYVKARETPVSRPLPDPQELRSAALDDLVPGIPDRDRPLPSALVPFMEALMDVPAAHWLSLHGLAAHHPDRPWLERQVAFSRSRKAFRIEQPIQVSQAFLGPLLTGALAPLHEARSRPLGADSLLEYQRQAHRILSLDDLLASPVPALRNPALVLHRRLDAAAGGLLETLRPLPPSLRLAWSEAAEEDLLTVEQPERWPAMAFAAEEDTLRWRTVVDLVRWWFRQLHGEASEGSRTAFRNVIRACLMLAASDDPAELLTGTVTSRPPELFPGTFLRLTLNRNPEPGALLQLLDEEDRVVGTLRVEDHDAGGTRAALVNLHVPTQTLGSTLRVAGRRP